MSNNGYTKEQYKKDKRFWVAAGNTTSVVFVASVASVLIASLAPGKVLPAYVWGFDLRLLALAIMIFSGVFFPLTLNKEKEADRKGWCHNTKTE